MSYFDLLPRELIIVIINSSDDYLTISSLIKLLKLYIDYEELISLRYPNLYLGIEKVPKKVDIKKDWEYSLIYRELVEISFRDDLEEYLEFFITNMDTDSLEAYNPYSYTENFLCLIKLYMDFPSIFDHILNFPKENMMYIYIYYSLDILRENIENFEDHKYFYELLTTEEVEIDNDIFQSNFQDIDSHHWYFTLIILKKWNTKKKVGLRNFINNEIGEYETMLYEHSTRHSFAKYSAYTAKVIDNLENELNL